MSKVTNNIDLSGALDGITEGGEHGVRLAVEHWLTEANQHVPHDDGTLEHSGEASASGTRGAVSYDTPYAVKQHEDMSLHHDGKGEAKWLENTGTREAKTMGQIIATSIRTELGT